MSRLRPSQGNDNKSLLIVSRSLSDPPSAPRNLTLTKVDRTSVTLSWSSPRDEGGWADTAYRIYCRNCGPEVRFNPSTETFQETFITMENLNPGTAYRVEVYCENGVSSVRACLLFNVSKSFTKKV